MADATYRPYLPATDMPRFLRELADFVGQPLPEALSELLDADECRALRARARALVRKGCFPGDAVGDGYPWPLV